MLVAGLLYACKKDPVSKNDPPQVKTGLIDSIYISSDTLKAWMDTAFIEVFARQDVEIHWSVDHGTIKGKGRNIYYFAGECCVGLNTIECKAVVDTAMQKIEIPVYVYSYFNKAHE